MITATFLGVSTVLLTDGTTSLLTDGFFSRPSFLRLLRPLRPAPSRVDAGLALASISRLDALLVAHSHYDHALDAPLVAARTGAVLIGSLSTRQIAVGYGRPASDVVVPTLPLRFGQFTVTARESVHSDGDRWPGSIDAPVTPPARVSAYRTGAAYSFHIGHPLGNVLVHASANYVPGLLAGLSAPTVFLGIGMLGVRPPAFQQAYWRETVLAVGARRVIPVHWDNFFRPLSKPLRPNPRPFDNVAAARHFLDRACADSGIELHWPLLGARISL